MTRFEPSNELDELAYEVIGAAIEVHRLLGPGYLESIYEQAMGVELMLRSIPFDRQFPVAVNYKDHTIGEGRIDILVKRCLVVELKAAEDLLPVHQAQVISYLKITNLHLGLLINFNVKILKEGIKRIVLS